MEGEFDPEAEEGPRKAGEVTDCPQFNFHVYCARNILTHDPHHHEHKGTIMKRFLVLLLAFGLTAGTLIAQDKTDKKETTKQETKKEKCDMDGCCKKDCKMMKSDKKKSSTKTEIKKDETKK